jgi:hypothetical protein
MKVIYEVNDTEIDKTNLNIHKYAEDMYMALSNIRHVLKSEKLKQMNMIELIDLINDEIANSKIEEICL